MPSDPALIATLDGLLAAIRAYPDPRRAVEWKQVFNQLKKTSADANRVANIVAMRGVEPLALLIEELRSPPTAGPADPNAPDDLTCQTALRAFRKRLKLTRLDEESRMDSHNPLSKGAQAQISAIIPPNAWPPEVWRELVRRGSLRDVGKGFCELTAE